jgi:lipoprotein-releasing system permease protein
MSVLPLEDELLKQRGYGGLRNRFELFIARRYLRAKRKTAVISIITVISIVGVAAGVMALIIALAITNGFRNTLQRNLLRASSHVSVIEKQPVGIENWRELVAKLSRLPHVRSAQPTLYGYVLFSSPIRPMGGVLKGIDLNTETRRSEILRNLKQGSLQALNTKLGERPGIILGSRLARDIGMPLNSVLTVISPQGELAGPLVRPSWHRLRVVGIFESGFYDLDSTWAFTSLKSVQVILGVNDVVNSIELEIDDIYRAREVAQEAERAAGPKMTAIPWMDTNRQLLSALQMDRAVTIVTIGLIQLVAALNILITLVMMVMEKHKDIAILMSMGARREQIRNIFVLQGVLIGVVGTVIGLITGYTLSILADRYRWIRLAEEIYSMSYVPFHPRWVDGVWVAAVAILISFIATIYPARSATRIAPAEVLRYE